MHKNHNRYLEHWYVQWLVCIECKMENRNATPHKYAYTIGSGKKKTINLNVKITNHCDYLRNGNGASICCHWNCVRTNIYSFHVFGMQTHEHDNEGIFAFMFLWWCFDWLKFSIKQFNYAQIRASKLKSLQWWLVYKIRNGIINENNL